MMEAAALLERRGRYDAEFFSALHSDADRRAGEVVALAKLWDVHLGSPSQLGQDPTLERLRIERRHLYRMLTLGWQIGRYEILHGSPLDAARQVVGNIERVIRTLLPVELQSSLSACSGRDLVTRSIGGIQERDATWHSVLLVGVGAFRASLVDMEPSGARRDELLSLCRSCFLEMDSRVMPDPIALGEVILEEQPESFIAIHQLLERHLSHVPG